MKDREERGGGSAAVSERESNHGKDGGKYVRRFEEIGSDDVDAVGGKNASLGEMISALGERGVRVPRGFAVTAEGYWEFLEHNGLVDDMRAALEGIGDDAGVRKAGKKVRGLIKGGEFPEDLREAIEGAYWDLCEEYGVEQVDVAVRSSATAEDLPTASFAGQLETVLNVSGAGELLEACRDCFASLFTDRAISYREEHGFDHMKVALSVGVQKMVRADLHEEGGGSGVMFTIDTQTGFPRVVVINAAWGLGENVVQGTIDPDEYRVFKPLLGEAAARPIVQRRCGKKQKTMVYSGEGAGGTKNIETKKAKRRALVLDDDRILTLGRWAVAIEDHYGRAMDIEWAVDGETGELFIVQARPETVESQKEAESLKTYALKERSAVIVEGLAIGRGAAAGKAMKIDDPSEGDDFEEGGILVTEMTDPDWVPLMRRAGAIVTEHGGRTSHAAIVSRELGVPAVIGAEDALGKIEDGAEVTINCTEGDTGFVHEGALEFEVEEVDLGDVLETRTRLMMNIASPDGAERWWRLPTKGIGLARLEFIIGNEIGVHPLALTRYEELETKKVRKKIDRLTRGYADRTEYFVDRLALGIGRIAAAQHPEPVIVRLSDFKTNEYAGLLGGAQFEPEEENPMLGFRGASRYTSDRYKDGFALECRALKRVREEMGFGNVVVMVPFCRTLEEADRVLGVMAEHGLTRGEKGLEVYAMSEVPSTVVLAEEFAERFDGFSIGTNDLTQLVLGVDRDSAELAHLYDEQNEAVKKMVRMLIERAHLKGRKVGLCGQAPSDHPEFAAFLVECGIDSISVNPDSVMDVLEIVARAERKMDEAEDA